MKISKSDELTLSGGSVPSTPVIKSVLDAGMPTALGEEEGLTLGNKAIETGPALTRIEPDALAASPDDVASVSSDTVAYERPSPDLVPTTRICAACGQQTNEAVCPTDGTPTLVREVLNTEALLIRVGDVIAERYRVTGVLGRGGFGAVYAAEHIGTQQPVAIKMLLNTAGGINDQDVRRFYREAQITAKLKHPNTVRVFDVGQTPAGALYIAMELLHGPTLEALLHERLGLGRVMEQAEVIGVATGILRSLQEAHGQQLVHRDLKPANIMLADSGDDHPVVKVLDFGIARGKDSSLTGAGTALGTPTYMSPEQCAGAAVDGRSDLYSLGIILYRCVVGEPPFADRNPLTLMFRHASAQVPDLGAHARTPVSAAFVAVVNKALSKRCEDRFDSAREMRVALEEVLRSPGSWASSTKAATTVLVADVGDRADVHDSTAEHVTPGSPQPVAAQPPIAEVAQTQMVDAGAVGVEVPEVAQAAPLARRPSWTVPAVIGTTLAVAVTAIWALGAGGGADKPGTPTTPASPAKLVAAAAPGAAHEPSPLAEKSLAVEKVVAPSAEPGHIPGPPPMVPSAVVLAIDREATAKQARARLAVLRQEIEGCGDLYRQSAATWDGKVSLTVTLGPGGAVTSVRQTGASSAFAQCVSGRLGAAGGFPEGPSAFEISESYAFAPSMGTGQRSAGSATAAAPGQVKNSRPKVKSASVPAKGSKEQLIPD